jgi:hypothetical protein
MPLTSPTDERTLATMMPEVDSSALSTHRVQPIETEYAGCRFRSRLEARWAVFFDHLEIPWEYEPQGFETSAGRYLPDFWLPEMRIWAEVKGRFSHADFVRTMGAAREMREPVDGQITPQLLLLGSIPRPGHAWLHVEVQFLRDMLLWQHVFFARFAGTWLPKPFGTTVVFRSGAFSKATEELTELFRREALEPAVDARLLADPDVDEAYRAARSARFEFGR